MENLDSVNKFVLQSIVLAILFCLSVSCANNSTLAPGQTSISDNLKHVLESRRKSMLDKKSDKAISDALLAPVNGSRAHAKTQEKLFDVQVKRLGANQFFRAIVSGTPHNVVVSNNVKGKISLSLKSVSVPEVMHLVSELYGYSIEKSGNTWFVKKAALSTRLFELNYLNLKRQGLSFTQVNSGQIQSTGNRSGQSGDSQNSNSNEQQQGGQSVRGTQIKTESDNHIWTELSQSIQAIIGDKPGRSIVMSPNANLMVVTAMPKELKLVERFLDMTEVRLQRQVILEAKILEVSLNDGFQSGINWELIKEINSGALLQINTVNTSLTDLAEVGGNLQVFYQDTDFTNFIELLQTQGKVKVLSSPRVSTVNNQKAVIKVGQDEFFVTEVSTTTVSGTTTTTTPDITLTPFFSGIALDVTPQINADNDVILHVHPAISEVEDQTKRLTLSGEELTLPLALSRIRESDTIVKAKNGQVIVIGGLMQNRVQRVRQGVPVLGSLPFIGGLFSQIRDEVIKSELVILIRPMIASNDQYDALLKQSLEQSRNIEGR